MASFTLESIKTKDLDDFYMGSGKLLKRAITKYGIENFKKDILEVYDEEWKMNLAERVLVVVDPEISYNLCSGGKGGFSYINRNGLAIINIQNLIRVQSVENRKKTSQRLKEAHRLGKVKIPNTTGIRYTLSDETRHRMSIASKKREYIKRKNKEFLSDR